MYRRRLLAVVGVAVATPGCLALDRSGGEGAPAPLFELQMSPVNATEIARRQVDSVAEYPQSFRTAVRNGEATYRAEGRGSVREEILVRADGTVYRLSLSQRGSASAGNYRYTIEFEEDHSTDATRSVRYDELPAVDRRALAEAGLSTPDEDQSFGIGTTLTYSPDERNASALVPEPETRVIQWPSGVRATVEVVSTSRERTTEYRITATSIGSLRSYGREFRERASFTLTNVSDAEEDVLRQAIADEDGYAVYPEDGSTTPTLPPGAARLADRFAAHADNTFERGTRFGNASGRFLLVAYGDRTYWTEFTGHVRAVDGPR